MHKEVMLWVGAGQIGMAIARRMGYGKKIIVGDKKPENAQAIAKITGSDFLIDGGATANYFYGPLKPEQ